MHIYRCRGQTEKIVAQAKGFTIQDLTTDLNIYSFWIDEIRLSLWLISVLTFVSMVRRVVTFEW